MRLVQSIQALAASLCLAASPATAQPLARTEPRPSASHEPVSRPQPAPPQRHSAASVAGAPSADQASGVVRPERDSEPAGRSLARALLVVPRAAFWIANAPVRAAAWASERYRIPLRVREALFNDAGSAGLVPIAWAGTDHGAGAGARFFHRDLAGRGEHLVAAAARGGRREPGAWLWIDSGERLGDRLLLRLDGRAERAPRERYFGLGNSTEAIDIPYQERRALLGATGELRIAGPFAARLSSSARWWRVDAASGATDAPPSSGEARAGSTHRLSLALDTRDRPARSELPGPRATGVALSAFAGATTGPAYGRLGGEARAQLPLGTRQRLLVVRALAEGVSGPLEDIPFVDLPRLGGPLLLRGYPADRFRDRCLGLASAEYRFDLGDALGAFLFADAGRVGRDLADLGAGDVRAGWGGGLDVRRGDLLLGRLTIASSIDGGLFVSAAFDPLGSPEGEEP